MICVPDRNASIRCSRWSVLCRTICLCFDKIHGHQCDGFIRRHDDAIGVFVFFSRRSQPRGEEGTFPSSAACEAVIVASYLFVSFAGSLLTSCRNEKRGGSRHKQMNSNMHLHIIQKMMFRKSLFVLLCATNVLAFGVAPVTKPMAISAVRPKPLFSYSMRHASF